MKSWCVYEQVGTNRGNEMLESLYFYLELHFKGKTEEKDFENKFESVRGAGRKVARQDWKRTGH